MTIVAQTAPRVTPAKGSRLRLLLQSFRCAVEDGLGLLGLASDRRQLAIAADGIHDAHLATAKRVAALGAVESDTHGCGCSARFDRLIRLINGAERADADEDGHHAASYELVGRGAARFRVVGSTADRLLAGRSE